jgi:hypothetical protein
MRKHYYILWGYDQDKAEEMAEKDFPYPKTKK